MDTLNGREFVDYLHRKYYPELEGPIIAVRKALAELDPNSPAFVALMQRQAKREISHATAFTKAVLQGVKFGGVEQRDAKGQKTGEVWRMGWIEFQIEVVKKLMAKDESQYPMNEVWIVPMSGGRTRRVPAE